MTEQPLPEESILSQALEIPLPADRASFLDRACGNNRELRAEVEALLRAHERSGDLLDLPDKPAVTIDEPRISEGPGTVIGPYKLLEQIGEGGFGVVFMAEQHQPVRRKVALKVLKPGMDTRQVVARFEAERQALAIMDHPNIAKVLDGGATASGRPYFVMDLVKGVPITEHCDQNHLTPRERLELFVSVCQAVQHAHHKGIIHRDLKPSNVLVTMHDTTPLVKVIDFGVAKALGQTLTDKTLFTGFAQMIGSPLYMSPEQAGQSGLDIDTRSDIYSLGVLLYELLTGTTPFAKDRFKQAEYDEIRRIIREEDPPKPSTRISTLGQAATTVSANRQSEPRTLSRLCRGELDWIVMNCLEKDRNRRYDTANALAADVLRYLRDEAVQACPPSAAYRFRKFARRNRVILTTASLIAATLVLGLAMSIWQAIRATRAEVLAEVRLNAESKAREAEAGERERAEANLQLARKAVDELYTELAGEMWDVPRMQPLQRKFLLQALEFYKEFAQTRSTDPATRFGTALAYYKVASIQLFLGSRPEAMHALEQAIPLLEKLVEEFPDEPQYRAELASAYTNRGSALIGIGQASKGHYAYGHAVALLEQVVSDSPNVAGYQIRLSSAYRSLGSSSELQLQEAEKLLQDAIRLCGRLAAEFPDNSAYKLQLASSHYCLGSALAKRGRNEAAEKPYREALALCGPADDALDSREQRSLVAASHAGLALVLAATSQAEEAESACREAIRLCAKLVADFPDVPDYLAGLAAVYRNLGTLLFRARKFKEAEEPLLKAAELYEKLVARFPGEPGYAMAQAEVYYHLVWTYDADHRPREKREAWKKIVQLYETSAAPILNDTTNERVQAEAYHLYARGLIASNRPREAEDACHKSVALFEKLAAQSPSDAALRNRLAVLHHVLGGLFQASARPVDAEQAYRKAVELNPLSALYQNDLAWLLVTYPDQKIHAPAQAVTFAKKATELRPLEYNVWNTLGVAHYRAGDYRDAITALEKSAELAHGIEFGFNAIFIAMAHWQLDEQDEARNWYHQAVEWMEKNAPQNKELRRFQVEAAELIGIEKKKP